MRSVCYTLVLINLCVLTGTEGETDAWQEVAGRGVAREETLTAAGAAEKAGGRRGTWRGYMGRVDDMS